MSSKERKEKWTKKIYEEKKRCYYKFDINNKGWFMDGPKIRQELVSQIIRTIGDTTDKYLVSGLWKYEYEIFQTKQALINSLYIEHENYYKKRENNVKQNKN